MQKPWEFVLPTDITQKNKAQKSRSESPSSNRESSKTQSEEASNRREQALQSEYLTERKRALNNYRGEVERDLLTGLESEVRTALKNIRGLISDDSFLEAVSHGVEEKLAKLFAYPSFEEWKRGK